MRNLEEILDHYGIKGQIVGQNRGPMLELIDFLPENGAKIKNVESVLDDIARELGVETVQVSVNTEANSWIFAIPAATMQTVDFKALLRNAPRVSGNLPICLGADVRGQPVFADLAKMPHLLVGGTTGSGKSVGLNTFILSLMAAKRPVELKLVLIDPKRIEFGVYNRQKYMLCPVVTETEAAARTLMFLVEEMERRYGVLEQSCCKNIKDYNEQTEDKILPYIVCVVDEFADLTAADKNIEKSVQRLAQKARACGIHLILATQRPSVDVITGVLKANFPSRLVYKVASVADSRTILDASGAEKLLGRGDALFLSSNGQLQRVHGAYIADDEIKAVLEPYRAEVKPLPVTSKPQRAEAEQQEKSESWLMKILNFWASLGKRKQKAIVDTIIYLFFGAVSKRKGKKK